LLKVIGQGINVDLVIQPQQLLDLRNIYREISKGSEKKTCNIYYQNKQNTSHINHRTYSFPTKRIEVEGDLKIGEQNTCFVFGFLRQGLIV
jgi:hypothetical protein